MRVSVITAFAATLLAGCAAGHRPVNYSGAAWMPEQRNDMVPGACSRTPTALPNLPVAHLETPVGLLLGPGDRVRIDVLGDADRISGVYVVGDDGHVRLPSLGSVPAAGLSQGDVEAHLRHLLVSRQIVQPLANAVRLTVLESAGVSVAVSGAVFNPGTVRAGERAPDSRVGQREGVAFGDANAGRTVTTALRAAGGVRPDADIRQVGLVRHDRMMVIDLRPSHDGTATGDVLVAPGDRLIVPSTGCFDPYLVRPSLVTQPGISVYMSNLTRPANNNAGAGVNEQTGRLPYGTRFLQGLVAMNCVGGSAMNSGRRAVLISRNPMTGQSVVVEREVEELVRHADRDAFDPYLMPGDSLACYDSRWMNLSDAIGMVTNAAGAVTPAILLQDRVAN